MRASVDDRIIIASNRVEAPVREGRVVECRHPDGSPPYVVQWSDTGQTGLFFPGPDAHVEHPGATEPSTSQPPYAPAAPHTRTWRVDVHLYETGGGDTTAHAVLVTEGPGVEGAAGAHLEPGEGDIPEIGDEVAVARALRRLSDRLLGVAADDIAGVVGHSVNLPE
jgi:hypothetical protein